jgi:hypothetical protein
MSMLDYLMEVPHSCIVDDANMMPFEDTAKIIRGRNPVEEFLACGV